MLDNACAKDLLKMLTRPDAPRITQLDLSHNVQLTWQVATALALALGAPPGNDTDRSLMAIDVRALGLSALHARGLSAGWAAAEGAALLWAVVVRRSCVVHAVAPHPRRCGRCRCGVWC